MVLPVLNTVLTFSFNREVNGSFGSNFEPPTVNKTHAIADKTMLLFSIEIGSMLLLVRAIEAKPHKPIIKRSTLKIFYFRNHIAKNFFY